MRNLGTRRVPDTFFATIIDSPVLSGVSRRSLRASRQNSVARLAHHFRRDAFHVNGRGGATPAGWPLEKHLLQRDVLRTVRTVASGGPRAVQAHARSAHRRRQMQRAGVGADEQLRSAGKRRQLPKRGRRRDAGRAAGRSNRLLSPAAARFRPPTPPERANRASGQGGPPRRRSDRRARVSTASPPQDSQSQNRPPRRPRE